MTVTVKIDSEKFAEFLQDEINEVVNDPLGCESSEVKIADVLGFEVKIVVSVRDDDDYYTEPVERGLTGLEIEE